MVYFPKWKVALVLVVCLLGVAYSLPNFLPKSLTESLPGGLPSLPVLIFAAWLGLIVAGAWLARRLSRAVDNSRPPRPPS